MSTQNKRANFDLSPEQDDFLTQLRAALATSSTKDTVLRAAQLTSLLVREARLGNFLYVGRSAKEATRLVIPEIEALHPAPWTWLVERPHPWRRQLWVKGRKLLASRVWEDARANGLSVEEAADNWDISIEAAQEVFRYCQAHQDLINAEADEERQLLKRQGVNLEGAFS
ncbi:hypothetical protein P2A63_05445 [Xanthomonas perforans]|uniref:hypothetical protein n=1 Tax=Xanthomonas perforans TaxID=442694 RepID=UPI001F225BAB|nr:hypothetical protein [Xanthomonas perforans]MCF5973056.1 hypothetical protein [Xanthomonas perforans]